MAILLNNNGYGNRPWQHELSQLMPDQQIHIYPDIPDREAISYALVWDHPDGDLATYPNLRAILSLGAGVEHLTRDPDLPDLPIIRLSDPTVAADMARHSLFWVLNFQRGYRQYHAQQDQKLWQRHDPLPAHDFAVAILGLGRIGRTVASLVQQAGFPVLGWDLSASSEAGIESYTGLTGLNKMLGKTRLLINCLPLTNDTEHLIDKAFLARLPNQAFLVNISRGAVVDSQAVVQALQSGQLAGAALDAFEQEPLAEDSLLWSVPNLHITPHMSGATYARSAAKVVAENIQRMEQGKAPFPLYDRAQGF